MQRALMVFIVAALLACLVTAGGSVKKHHKHHKKHHLSQNSTDTSQHKVAKVAAPGETAEASEKQIVDKMKVLETELAKKEDAAKVVVQKGHIEVNGPLPADFAERFAQAVSKATGCDPSVL
jgi:hypothetical protein